MSLKEKVIVLMSTYNGERYLREQLDSIVIQKNVDIELLIRDDESSDSTIEILNEYSNNYPFISWYSGRNIGPTKSFFDLISKVKDADFYAFCDQDDVWDDDKLFHAINKLKLLSGEKPNLYYSNLRIVDENLKFYRNSHNKVFLNENKYSCFTENLCTGCTAVFNFTAKELIKKHLPNYCTMHDTWIYIVCKMFGNCIYDKEPHISYRQHQFNVVGSALNQYSIKSLKDKFFRIFDRELQPRYNNALNFYQSFEDELSVDEKNKIIKLLNYKKTLRNRISLFFDKDYKCTTLYGTLRFKLHILWGTV